MRVETLAVVPAGMLDEAWRFYRETFAGLAAVAVQRHLLHREEFDELMAEPRVTKWAALADDGTVIGLAAMTTDLSTLPLLSHEFFAHRWPEHYEQRRIAYCVFIGARSGPAGKGVFVALQTAMYEVIKAVRGMVVLDICSWNEENLNLPKTVESILKPIAGDATATRLDSQSYWLYEFPEAS